MAYFVLVFYGHSISSPSLTLPNATLPSIAQRPTGFEIGPLVSARWAKFQVTALIQ